MSKLLISSIAPDELSVKFRMGGGPLVPVNAGFKWADCHECSIPMCFYGQIPLLVCNLEHPNAKFLIQC